MTRKWHIGIVIPWFGSDLKGGAEQQAWQVAHRLAGQGCEVSVLTTCSQSFLHSWHVNHYRPGVYREQAVTVKRFPVRLRHARAFNRVVAKLLALPQTSLRPGCPPIDAAEERVYWEENINSPQLIEHLLTKQHEYDAFIFLPYLFPLSRKGIEAVPAKALLQACLHDECYAYLEGTMEAFARCRGLLFNSVGEYLLAQRLYGPWIQSKSYVIGEGIEPLPAQTHAPSELLSHFPAADYLLCLGRRCREKNTDVLIEAFDAFKRRHLSPLKLVLAGPADLPIPPKSRDIIDIGLVSEEFKASLIRHCKALVNPSINESFSRVIFEAWQAEKPILVHKDCLATFTALKEAGFAGWAAGNQEEFVSCFAAISECSAADSAARGARGRAYAAEISDWQQVMGRYLACFQKLFAENSAAKGKRALYIYPYGDWQELASQDLACTSRALAGQGWQLDYTSPKPFSALKALGLRYHPAPTGNELVEKPAYSLLLWQGEKRWREGEGLCRGIKAPKLLRRLNTSVLEPSFLELFTGQLPSSDKQEASSGQLQALAPLFSHHLLQRQPVEKPAFKRFNKRAFNVLLLCEAELSQKSWQSLNELCQGFVATYHHPLSLLIPTASDRLTALKAIFASKQFREIPTHFIKLRSSSLPAYLYSVSDCMLLLDDPKIFPWQALAALSYGLPCLSLNSPYWQTYLALPELVKESTGPARIQPFIAALKLLGEEGSFRHHYQLHSSQQLAHMTPGCAEQQFLNMIRPVIKGSSPL